MKKHLMFTFLTIIIISCSRNKNHPGYKYWPEMTEYVSKNSFSANNVFKDGKTMQEPVKGSIPRGIVPYQFEKNAADRQLAGQHLTNIFQMNDSIVNEGKALFSLICSQCHGINGNGKGYLFTEKLYPYPPANLTSDKLKNVADGEIFHVASVGFNLMGAHASMLKQDERWKIVCYVRFLQKNSELMTPDD